MNPNDFILSSSKLCIKDYISLFIDEIGLIEQRILHIENIQYKLRQFSLAFWAAILGVATGANIQEVARIILLVVITCVPFLFLYIDAWYASNAQNLRSRRNEITYFINFDTDSLERLLASGFIKKDKCFPVLDLTGYYTVGNDPQTKYRRSIFAKLCRHHRIFFYSFQIIGSLFVLSYYLFIISKNKAFFLLILIYPIFCILIYLIDRHNYNMILSNTPKSYLKKKKINNLADNPSVKVNDL